MKRVLSISLIGLYLLLPGVALAAPPPRIDGLTAIFDRIMALLLPFGGLLALGYMVYGGYVWMMSGGDPAKVKKAQGILTWAVLGLIFLSIFGMILFSVVKFLET
ncbi:hypothetical protein H6763_03085 [Candidatus Nomurabacteria bacterium]|uniref:CD225/dispanin family protein n=1 Tax=Candidatus Dojkabacteria bacterium TaxID=2099670 RepID=A0A955I1N3_9BACT|nr:hypothetical protein [Candidatus Dojkabacteria bacterium]MCB9789469.1 hypothetical protein [Candidatus Nomurabacteria bacterium]MCB9803791.1 hypothetical protein [Candidatus Nomurabacteria bacterium]